MCIRDRNCGSEVFCYKFNRINILNSMNSDTAILETEGLVQLAEDSGNINNEFTSSVYAQPNFVFENGSYYAVSVDNKLPKTLEPNSEAIHEDEENELSFPGVSIQEEVHKEERNSIEYVVDISVLPKEKPANSLLDTISKDVLKIRENISKIQADRSLEKTLNLFKQNYVALRAIE
eukprot:TRINITY_DN15857_c0_g1_i1.p1 TRINITY_DN15857_c0_g1~~TRINITY_DN15857_c0_g1_i1.p1  ORF type:complete len:177 (-),score=31.67 TRINITY_DN15857_c0_g1_i1:94-624(-)